MKAVGNIFHLLIISYNHLTIPIKTILYIDFTLNILDPMHSGREKVLGING